MPAWQCTSTEPSSLLMAWSIKAKAGSKNLEISSSSTSSSFSWRYLIVGCLPLYESSHSLFASLAGTQETICVILFYVMKVDDSAAPNPPRNNRSTTSLASLVHAFSYGLFFPKLSDIIFYIMISIKKIFLLLNLCLFNICFYTLNRPFHRL